MLHVDAALQTNLGVRYIEFAADDLDLHAVARLSVAYALFVRGDDVLRPVQLPAVNRYDDDLLTIQRYTGKTNESFTKLLVNLTLPPGATTLLDPMAGRGTTLNQAVIYGLDAVGIEIDKKDCEAYRTFFTTWLKNKRLPHKARPDKARFSVEFARDRKTFDSGGGQKVTMINGDSRDADEHLQKNSVDAIVVDLPYNVRHREAAVEALVAGSLPAWRHVLRPGGAIGVAWNTRTTKRAAMVATFEAAGFGVLDGGPYGRFEHRVDQSITRDLLIARAAGPVA